MFIPDSPCVGSHGSQGGCCGGLYCHKNQPTWREGRCYYLPVRPAGPIGGGGGGGDGGGGEDGEDADLDLDSEQYMGEMDMDSQQDAGDMDMDSQQDLDE